MAPFLNKNKYLMTCEKLNLDFIDLKTVWKEVWVRHATGFSSPLVHQTFLRFSKLLCNDFKVSL